MATTAPPSKPTMTTAHSYDADGIHQTELVYSTPLSTVLGFHKANQYIHSIPSLPYPAELFVFLLGYAFNPVCIVPWMAIIATTGAIPSSPQQQQAPFFWFPPLFYLTTILVTLAFTETCKFSFRATRPEGILSVDFRQSKLRRFGFLVASLKSKHSFPSGDSAQAMNLVLFWYYYISPLLHLESATKMMLLYGLAFGVFYPGVAFARVFYHCHWIEDTIAGGLLAFTLHQFIMPSLSNFVFKVVNQYTGGSS